MAFGVGWCGPAAVVAGPRLVRRGSSAVPSPVRISLGDLRRFSASHSLCRPRSPRIIRTCNGFPCDLRRFSLSKAFSRRRSLASPSRVLGHTVPGPHTFSGPATASPVTCDGFRSLRPFSVAGPWPHRRGSLALPSPVRISLGDLRRFSASRALCRPRSQVLPFPVLGPTVPDPWSCRPRSANTSWTHNANPAGPALQLRLDQRQTNHSAKSLLLRLAETRSVTTSRGS